MTPGLSGLPNMTAPDCGINITMNMIGHWQCACHGKGRPLWGLVVKPKLPLSTVRSHFNYTPKLLGGGGILVSLRPSLGLPVCPSVHPSRIPCLLYSAYTSGWIHFIFLHLIKQLQTVCHVYSFCLNLKMWIFGNFFKFVTLTLSFFDLGSDVNH